MSSQAIIDCLKQHFAPQVFEWIDESHKHIGHVGHRGGGHYRLIMVSHAFEGQNRIERQRSVQTILKDFYPEHIHALSLSLHTPQEYQQKNSIQPLS